MSDFSILIQDWYSKNKRDLPWRTTNDPYKIWLSEIILQQTRVDQGMSYYQKFVLAYPKVNDLAAAAEDDVLNNWQGLGYYSRARNLQAAAKSIVEDHKGIFPTTHEDILKLKGVGPYTAAAIASIAYNIPKAVVDGNVYRVLSRYLGISTPIDSTSGKKEFAEAAQELLDEKNPGDHNQAVMELGALVCLPKNPDCTNCPLVNSCYAHSKNEQLNFPVKEKKTKVRDRYFHYFIIESDKNIYIKKRGPKDVWQGLYDFPLHETNSPKAPSIEELSHWGIERIEEDKQLKHILSHQRIYATFWKTTHKNKSMGEGFEKVEVERIEEFPMPQLLIRYMKDSALFSVD